MDEATHASRRWLVAGGTDRARGRAAARMRCTFVGWNNGTASMCYCLMTPAGGSINNGPMMCTKVGLAPSTTRPSRLIGGGFGLAGCVRRRSDLLERSISS